MMTFAISLDPDQDRQNLGPNLNPSCFSRLFDGLSEFSLENVKWALTWYGQLTWESVHAWNLIILYY